MNPRYVVCAYCERTRCVTRDGKVFKHGKCLGSGRPQAGFQLAPGEMTRMKMHLYSENNMHTTACGKPLEGRGRVRNVTGVERDGTCHACIAARVMQPIKRYTVKCTVRGCYDSFPMNEDLAAQAKKLHAGLGPQHVCELIPAKHHPYCECDECRNESEAQLKCSTCVNGHPIGKLCKPCNEHECECWCNRSATPPLPEHRQRRAEPVSMTTEQATKILTDAMMEALAKSIAAAAARGELTAESLASIAKAAGNNAAQALMCDDE